MMMIDNKFEISEIVYLTTDDEQKRRVVTAIKILPDDKFVYELSCGPNSSMHYDFEITADKNIIVE